MTKLERSPNILEKRPYQNEALLSISDFVKDLLRGLIEVDINKVFKNAALLNMATGSGKTFTIGTALENIIKLRDRFNSRYNQNHFENLNIVVLTHRIDLVNQFRDDLVFGRDDKHPILSDKTLDSLHISTYHSKADKEDQLLDNEELDLGEGNNNDNIIFSTQQTAGLIELVDKLDYVDIILIDESHNIKLDSDYYDVVKTLASKTRTGEEALILPVTATPNNQTRKLFGQEIFEYGLEKYLNSEHSPSVEYYLVTNSNADKKLIEKLSAIVEQSKHESNYKAKKELIKEAEELFNEIMTSFADNESLVNDLFERAEENGELEETVIFADSIESADELARIINEKVGEDDFAMSFHSKNDKNNAINKLRDKNHPCKVILAVGKLNEGIDLPKVKNVVFWRGTDSETIFFQQFGRGLRGDNLVRYFDYVGGLKNFAWINGIFKKYQKIFEENQASGNNSNGNNGKGKLSLLGGDIGASHHNIDLVDVGLDIVDAKEELNLSNEELIEYLIGELEKKGIIDMQSLLSYGVGQFKEDFGLSIPGKILGKLLKSISVSILEELGKKIGYEKLTEDKIINEFKKELEKKGIIDIETLLSYKTKNFKEDFGRKIIGKILGRRIFDIKISLLEELGEKLGFEKLTEEEIIENFRKKLKKEGIVDMKTFIKYTPERYRKNFGLKVSGKILGRSVNSVTLKLFEELGEKVGFNRLTEEKIIEDFKNKLKKEGIVNIDNLLNYSISKLIKKFGKKIIIKVLGKTEIIYNNNVLIELGEKLGFENIVEYFKKELEKEGIIDMKSLVNYTSKKYSETFGVKYIQFILRRKVANINLYTLEKLGKKIGFEELTKEKIIEDFKKELEKEGIIDMKSLVNYTSKKYSETFGKKTLGLILGRSINSVTLPVLEELGTKVGFEELTKEKIIEDFKKELGKEGINNINSLLTYGVNNFSSDFGLSIPGKILGKRIEDVNLSVLEELGERLWNNSLIKTFKKELEKKGINNMESLFGYGVLNFHKDFGVLFSGRILGKYLSKTTKSDLRELGIKLGFNEIDKTPLEKVDEILISENIDELKVFLKVEFKKIGVINNFTLINYGPTKFRVNFGRKAIGKILGKNIKIITLNNLEELGNELGFDSFINGFILELEKKGINTKENLLCYGANKFGGDFSQKDIGRILGKTIKHINKSIIKELGEKLYSKETPKKQD